MKNRRIFLKEVLGIVGFGALLLKSGNASAKKLAVKLDEVPSLGKVGGSATVKLAGQEILLIRLSASEIRGVSPRCTHQNCDVKYNLKTSKLDCPCHGSSFEPTGKVLKGPATKNLKSFPAVLDKDRIIVTVE